MTQVDLPGFVFGKKRAVVALQTLAGVVFSLLIVVPAESASLSSYALVLLFACFFLSGLLLPEGVFYHPLFDISLLSLNGLFFVFAMIFNPSIPWPAVLLFYFLFFAVAISGGEEGSFRRLSFHCAVLISIYVLLLFLHGRSLLKDGIGILIGVPSFLALSALYVHLARQAGWEKEKAEEKERIRTEVIATLAHDIKQPLSAIMGYSEILSSALNGASPSELAGRIKHNSQVIFDLVTGFLDVARLEALGGEEKEVIHVEALLHSVLEDAASFCQRKNISLSVSLSALPEVMGNRAQLERVFRNLLSNAVKFTPEGGEIRVCAIVDGEEVRVSVEDTGEGISKEDLPLLFTRFKRFGKKDKEGSGLGLYIVKAVVEAHGGRVTVRSERGRGSVFTVHLPAFKGESPQENRQLPMDFGL